MSSLDKRADRHAQLRAQVDYHGHRLVLHQRLHGTQPSARLAELEVAYARARERLADASDQTPETGAATRPRLD